MNSGRTIVRWSKLFKREFEERLKNDPTVYLPIGICEPHGHIAAFGLDLIKAEYLCCEAASRFGGIVAPSQGYQIHETGYHAPWLEEVVGNVNPYMTSMPPNPVLYFFLYQLRTFHQAGFNHAIVITGHAGGNQFDFRMVAEAFMKISNMKVDVFSDPELTNGKYEGDHAGKYELSQLLYIQPGDVRMDRLNEWIKEDPTTRFAQGEDANEASADYGKEIIEDCLQGIYNHIKHQNSNEVSSCERKMIPYDVMENTWNEIKAQSKKWMTHNLRPDQKQTSKSSIWQQFERWV